MDAIQSASAERSEDRGSLDLVGSTPAPDSSCAGLGRLGRGAAGSHCPQPRHLYRLRLVDAGTRRQNCVELLRRTVSNSQHSSIGDQTGPTVARRFHGFDASGVRKFDTRRPVQPTDRSTPVRSTRGCTTYTLGLEVQPYYSAASRSSLVAGTGANSIPSG